MVAALLARSRRNLSQCFRVLPKSNRSHGCAKRRSRLGAIFAGDSPRWRKALLIVNGGDRLAFVCRGDKDVDDALLSYRINFSTFEKVVDLIIT